MWDPLAQLVEHNTFNVGVLGSSPKRITKEERQKRSFFYFIQQFPIHYFIIGKLGTINIVRKTFL